MIYKLQTMTARAIAVLITGASAIGIGGSIIVKQNLVRQELNRANTEKREAERHAEIMAILSDIKKEAVAINMDVRRYIYPCLPSYSEELASKLSKK